MSQASRPANGRSGTGRGSGGGAATPLRMLGAPRSAGVSVDGAGTPVAVVIGRGRAPRRVSAVRERWRIDDEWWRQPLSREYVTVALEDGRALTLYEDRVGGGWWVQGEEG